MNKQELIKEVNGLPSTLLDKRVLIDKSAVLELVDQLDEPERVVVPKFVAEWVEEAREQKLSLGQAMEYYTRPQIIELWFEYSNNQETFARAWLDGYEVEQEKLYTVQIPNPNNSTKKVFLHKDIGSGIMIGTYISNDDGWKSIKSAYLTEAEIKKDFDWDWK